MTALHLKFFPAAQVNLLVPGGPNDKATALDWRALMQAALHPL